jgi:hypothetical protein
MKNLVLLFTVILFVMQIQAQSNYGTPLIKGSVTFHIKHVYETYSSSKLLTKTETDANFSSQLTGTCVSKEFSDWMFKSSQDMRGEKVGMNNYITTLKEDEIYNKNNDVPQFPVSANIESKTYGKSPCSNADASSEEYKAVLTKHETYSGILMHHDIKEARMGCSIVGIEKCDRYLFLTIYCGGTYFVENSKSENVHVDGEWHYMICEDEKEAWYQAKGNSGLLVGNSPLENCSFSVSENSEHGWFGSNGVYKTSKKDEDGNIRKKDMMLMRIDTADFFKYLREKPSVRTFSTSGSYIEEYRNLQSGDHTMRSETITATLTLGKISDFTITAVNEQEYKDWLPGNPDFPESFKTLSLKAKFSEGGQDQKEKIVFMITEASHLPGICTNFPIKPPETDNVDIVFAPQDKQTDPNIKIVNDTMAITNKPADEAVVVIHSKDFGAFCKVRAMTESSGKFAECTYNDKKYISIPYDINNNYIADKWEEDMGVEGIDKLEDIDGLPAKQGRSGDGLTAFEEYRGFISEGDVVAACDKDHNQRTGKHVRTSPLCRDVFIHDPDALFAKYVARTNPAECHWHYVNREQLSLPPAGEVSSVIKANEVDFADPSKNPSNAILDAWNKKEYRRVNVNTPKSLRITKQFGMYLIISPLPSTESGFSVEKANKKDVVSPLENNHICVIPQYAVMKAAQSSVISTMIKNSSHPALIVMYPPSVQDQAIDIAYEAMVSHEVGHGLGIPHHTMGSITFRAYKLKMTVVINNINLLYSPLDDNTNEICLKDNDQYLITNFKYAFWAMGVTECCMRYTLDREIDFLDGKVLQHSQKYCRKGQTFVDANGITTEADGCFSKIIIRCSNE